MDPNSTPSSERTSEAVERVAALIESALERHGVTAFEGTLDDAHDILAALQHPVASSEAPTLHQRVFVAGYNAGFDAAKHYFHMPAKEEAWQTFAALQQSSEAPTATERNAYEGKGGWQDGRLGQAYDLIDAVRTEQAQHPESGIDEELKRARDAVEAADCEIEKVSGHPSDQQEAIHGTR